VPDPACVRNPRVLAPHVGRHRVRSLVGHARRRNQRRIDRSASGGGIGNRTVADCAPSARGTVRHPRNLCAGRGHWRGVSSFARLPSPCPLPQAGEGNTFRNRVTVGHVGNRRP
jgi:hypothetical protein